MPQGASQPPGADAVAVAAAFCPRPDGIPLDEDLLALAEKARFSQHTITDEELQVLEDARDRRIAALRSQPMKKKDSGSAHGQVLY